MPDVSRSKCWIPVADIPSDAGVDCDQIAYEHVAAIQSHCLFLSLCRWDRRILNVSENCERAFAIPLTSTLGRRCDESLIGGIDSLIGSLNEWSIKGTQHAIEYGKVCIQSQEYVVRATVCRDRIQLELEKAGESAFLRCLPTDLLALGTTTLRTASKLKDLSKFLEDLGILLPFYRLGIFRFDESDHGEIIFERRSDPLAQSYEGLRFPARDIPLSARKMMLSTPVRFTRDRSQAPSKIFPRKDPITNHEIDMTYSRNRGSAGSCQEYYANMGIRSSLIIPLVCDGKLWGMICGHHNEVINITPDIDPYLAALGSMVSASIKNIIHNEIVESAQRGREVVNSLRSNASQVSSTLDNLKANAGDLLRMFPCDGLILSVSGNLIAAGAVPAFPNVHAYAQKVWELAESKPLVTNQIFKAFPDLALICDEFAGVLAIPLDTAHQDIAIWLRKEQRRQVSWAGDPTQKVRQKSDGSYFLEPRSSFELWAQAVHGISRDWAENEIRLAQSSGMQLSLALLAWYSNQSNLTKAAFLSSVRNQLRTPLTAIQGYTGLLSDLLEGLGGSTAETCLDFCKIISRSGKNLLEMVNEILDLTHLEAGQITIEATKVDVPKLVKEIVSELNPVFESKAVRLSVEIVRSIPRHIVTDARRLRQILIQLLSHSIKYVADGRVKVQMAVCDLDSHLLKISVVEQGQIADRDFQEDTKKGHSANEDSIAKRRGEFSVGFAISKKLAELMGGDIVVENDATKACRFHMTIAMNHPSHLDLIDQEKFHQQYVQINRGYDLPRIPRSVGRAFPQQAQESQFG